ncbi:MAG: multidrug transporter [Sphingobacteriaceae bacterium]|nr:multidrug transporter [Cytophagaceae bacterium]
MHTGKKYRVGEFLLWTRRNVYWLLVVAAVPTVLYEGLGWKWLAIPWTTVAMLGTATAFIVGFKNNATYNRTWEARQIWGSIVNSSRTWGIMVRDFVRTDDGEIHRQLIYRHIAWLTALRFQLRESRNWENTAKPYNAEYLKFYTIPERESKLEEELKPYLSPEEQTYILGKKNRATQLIALQSKHLRQLEEQGLLENYRYIEMETVLGAFYEHQGKSERIKNFPYPRQFASINMYFIRLFAVLLPFGLFAEFEKFGEHGVWLVIPFSTLISWVFTSLEQVGESTENPFEGSPNDIPITSMSRTIEIDLRDMLDEKDLPPALQPVNNILM